MIRFAKWLSVSAFLLIGLAASIPAQEKAPGIEISLAIAPAQWTVGTKLEFACTARNVGDKPLRLPLWGLELAQVLEVTDPDGNVVRYDGGRDATRRLEGDAFVTIEPGKSHAFKLTGQVISVKDRLGGKMLVVHELLGGVWTWPLADGVYTVRAVYDVSPDNEWMIRQAGEKGTWTGRVVSEPVKVTIGEKKDAGGEAVNGLKLTLKADKTELRMTPRQLRRATADTPRWNVEPTKLTLTFTNVGGKPIKLNAYDLVWSRLKLDVTGPDGDSVRVVGRLVERSMAAPREKDFPTIDAGESLAFADRAAFPGEFGGSIYFLMKPGEYRVKAIYSLPSGMMKDFPLVDGAWTGIVTSNEIVLKAKAD